MSITCVMLARRGVSASQRIELPLVVLQVNISQTRYLGTLLGDVYVFDSGAILCPVLKYHWHMRNSFDLQKQKRTPGEPNHTQRDYLKSVELENLSQASCSGLISGLTGFTILEILQLSLLPLYALFVREEQV